MRLIHNHQQTINSSMFKSYLQLVIDEGSVIQLESLLRLVVIIPLVDGISRGY
jgi:hypothetical protein